MKVIVISGASSKVGKTTLAGSLRRMLEGAEVVKTGHGERKPGIQNHFYESGTPFPTIRENHGGATWLIVESNSILQEIAPDLVIYLEGEHPKPSAQYARCKADRQRRPRGAGGQARDFYRTGAEDRTPSGSRMRVAVASLDRSRLRFEHSACEPVV
jgi:hypothetical protein